MSGRARSTRISASRGFLPSASFRARACRCLSFLRRRGSHGCTQAHKTCGVFSMVQQFFDSDLAVSVRQPRPRPPGKERWGRGVSGERRSAAGCGESSGLFLCATGKLSFQSCSVQEEHQLELAALLFVFTSRHGFHFLPTLLCTDFEKLQYLLLESDALINEASDSL